MSQTFRIGAVVFVGVLCLIAVHAHGAAGARDNHFNPVLNGEVSAIALQPDGRIVIGGGFTNINGIIRAHIARLNCDGSLDQSFDPGAGIAGVFGPVPHASRVLAIAIQPDGRILVGGEFTNVNGTARNCIARLNCAGSLDASFNPGSGVVGLPAGAIQTIAIQTNGQILVGGNFSYFAGAQHNGFARLNADGGLDSSIFSIGGNSPDVESLVIQRDSKVVVGGKFGLGTNINITRFNADGSLDTTFDSTGVGKDVASMAVQSDGKLLIGAGSVLSSSGAQYPGIARLDTNGTLDATFDVGTGANGPVLAIAVQPDGKVLVAGGFTTINGIARSRIARLNIDGGLDESFDPGAGLDGPCSPFCPSVSALAIQKDGRVIAGGSFSTIDNVACTYLTRMVGDEAMLCFGPLRTGGDFVVRFGGTTGLVYTVEYQDALAASNWQKLTNLVVPGVDEGFGIGVFELRDSIPAAGQRFYRIVYPPY